MWKNMNYEGKNENDKYAQTKLSIEELVENKV